MSLDSSTLLKLLCITITFHPDFITPYEVIRDNSRDINHVLYGDLTKMDDMFIDAADYEALDVKEDKNPPKTRRNNINSTKDFDNPFDSLVFELLSTPSNTTGFDSIDDFNKITMSLNNVTRRFWHDDPQDRYRWVYIEDKKKAELVNAAIQFLLHSRYKIIKAIKQKEPIKLTKRYRLGYLFNRLKRIQYEISKLIHEAVEQKYYAYSESIFRFYEESLKYHVDAKDIIAFIKSIDTEPDDMTTKKTHYKKVDLDGPTEPDSPWDTTNTDTTVSS